MVSIPTDVHELSVGLIGYYAILQYDTFSALYDIYKYLKLKWEGGETKGPMHATARAATRREGGGYTIYNLRLITSLEDSHKRGISFSNSPICGTGG